MSACIFDGKKFANGREAILLNKVRKLRLDGVTPKLVAILVGNDPASRIYVGLKQKAAERVGITLHLIKLKQVSAQKLLHLIKELNTNNSVHGIMVQLPLPGKLDVSEIRTTVLDSIAAEKDVDGLRTKSTFVPAAVKAVLYSIKEAQKLGCVQKDFNGIKICVVGATGMIGRPLVEILKAKGAEIIPANTKTKDLRTETRKGDVLISATGVFGIIKGNMVKPGAVVIDVGAPKGDVDFASVNKVASFITPVPGGIGPVTVVSLLENVVEATRIYVDRTQ